jgi:ATP/maltotriose-dependent transcriptional regulator MalT
MENGGVLRRPGDPAPVVRPTPAPRDGTHSAADRAALVETPWMAVARSQVTLAQTAASRAQARRLLASYMTLARVREFLADRASGPDGSHHTPPAEYRHEDADAKLVQACTATTQWIVAAEEPALDDRSVMVPAPTTGPSRSPLVRLPMLTQRELEVLGYATSMLSAAEIGTELFVSVNTVKAHLRSIYRKLGVTRRRDAVILARRRGLL